MVGRQGRGTADQMKLRGNNRYTILENGTFTSCLPGSNSWSVVGSQVIQDREEQVAEIWNARFKLGPVPVFYSPYLQLPIGDRRRSGFLIPNAKYSNNDGFQFALPYYWNIAPQMDATITPNYLSRRGLQWQNEFRYLTQAGTGLVEFDYLPSDDEYKRDEAARNSNGGDANRWLFSGVTPAFISSTGVLTPTTPKSAILTTSGISTRSTTPLPTATPRRNSASAMRIPTGTPRSPAKTSGIRHQPLAKRLPRTAAV